MDASTLVLWGDIAAFGLAIGGVLFLLAYSLVAKWWRWREGWFIALSSLGLSSLFWYIAAARFGWLPPLDDSSTRAWLRLTIFGAFGVALLWVSVLLLLAQIEQRRKEK